MSEMFTSWLSLVIISMLLLPCCPELGHTVSFRNFGQQVNKLTEVDVKAVCGLMQEALQAEMARR